MSTQYSSAERISNGLLAALILFILGGVVYGATPNPGHPWTEVGDGFWASTSTTAYRTFTFPDATATVMTTLDVDQGDLLYGSAASTTGTVAKDTNATRYLSNTGASNNPAWAQINLPDGVTGSSSLANGGTATNLSASNGGILYSASAALAVLAGNGTAGKLLRAGSSAAPAWSTSVYPSAVTATNDVLMSNGTNWQSTFATTTTVPTNSYATIGAITQKPNMASLTVFNVGLFNIPARITVNQISASVGSASQSGTLKQCIYSESGTKLIDVTSASPSANATLSTAVSPSVTLMPGNYYYAIGCATTCSVALKYWSVTAAGPYTTLQPAGKKVYEGTVTMTSGTCNTTLPTITATASSTPMGRLDN
jgi:hypothetical protein